MNGHLEPFEAPELERACLWSPDPVVRAQAWDYLCQLHARNRQVEETLRVAALIDRAVASVRKALDGDA